MISGAAQMNPLFSREQEKLVAEQFEASHRAISRYARGEVAFARNAKSRPAKSVPRPSLTAYAASISEIRWRPCRASVLQSAPCINRTLGRATAGVRIWRPIANVDRSAIKVTHLTADCRVIMAWRASREWALRPVGRFARHAWIERYWRLGSALGSLGPTGRSLRSLQGNPRPNRAFQR